MTRRIALAALITALGCAPAPKPPPIATPLRYGPVAPAPDAAFRAAPPPSAPLDPAPPFAFTTFTLANGVEVVVAERHTLPTVSARLVIARGARDLGSRLPDRLDLALAAQQELFDASGRAGLGIVMATDGDADGCQLAARGLSFSLDQALEPLAEMALRARYPAGLVAWIRERWRDGSHPPRSRGNIVINNRDALLFGADAGYGAASGRERDEADPISEASLVALHRALFQPAHATLVIAGDVLPGDARAAAERWFGGWKASGPTLRMRADPPAAPPAGARVAVVDSRDGVLVHGYLLARGPAPTDADADALALIASMLGEFEARLHQEVRVEIGAAYAFAAGVEPLRTASVLEVGGAFEPERAAPALAAIVGALRELRDHGVDERALDAARTRLVARWRARAASAETTSALVARAIVAGRPLGQLLDHAERLARVTPADVQRAARRWLADDALRIVAVGDADRLTRELAALGLGQVERRDAFGARLK